MFECNKLKTPTIKALFLRWNIRQNKSEIKAKFAHKHLYAMEWHWMTYNITEPFVQEL